MKYLSLIIIFVLAFVGYIGYSVPKTPVLKQDFVINKGDTIVNLPKKLNIDINPTLFKFYTKFFVRSFTLQAGTYSIDKNITLETLFTQALRNPTSKDITITLLPGWNIWDMDVYLAKEGITKAGDFTAAAENIPSGLKKSFPFISKATTLEGFLIPDTYRISPTSTSDDIVKLLLSAFNDKIYKEFNFASDAELYKTIIFASIVEKEEKSSVNKPVVAGILQKRFAEKMPIGADATVCYAFRLTMSDCTPAFIGEHIYEKSSYNTRSSLILPPTPISNPSVDTIQATINSEASKYYYYLHDNDGVIHYGKSLEEHNMNRVKYLGK